MLFIKCTISFECSKWLNQCIRHISNYHKDKNCKLKTIIKRHNKYFILLVWFSLNQDIQKIRSMDHSTQFTFSNLDVASTLHRLTVCFLPIFLHLYPLSICSHCYPTIVLTLFRVYYHFPLAEEHTLPNLLANKAATRPARPFHPPLWLYQIFISEDRLATATFW